VSGGSAQDQFAITLNYWDNMGSLKRKMARNKAKKNKKIEKKIAKKLGMFNIMGDECSACQKPFDKKSKEDVQTWKVIVREQEKIVRLYCPNCWGMANKLIKEIEDDLRVQHERGSESSDESKP